MTCDCYKVGGPFIAEDPNCHEHGYAAQKNESQKVEIINQLSWALESGDDEGIREAAIKTLTYLQSL